MLDNKLQNKDQITGKIFLLHLSLEQLIKRLKSTH